MDFSWNEEQLMLIQAAQNFMAREAPKQTIVELQGSETGITPQLWKSISDVGWLGMLVPPEYGGSGGSITDAGALYEELGRGPLPGPLFSSGVLGALTIREGGSAGQLADFLPGIAQGSHVFTLALGEPDFVWGPEGVRARLEGRNGKLVLNGTKVFVSYARVATHLIVAVRTGDGPRDISLLIVDVQTPGIDVRSLPGFNGWEAAVTFNDVKVPASNLLSGVENTGWQILERAFAKALPVLCMYMVGGCQAVFEMSVAYSQRRIQFGVPIGKFPRVQDHIIRLVNQLDSARWTAYEALWKCDTGQPDAAAASHLAKAVASEAYWEACNAAHEVHAGIGSDVGYGLAQYTRMSRTLFYYLGDPKWHKRRMADALDW